MVSPPTSIPLPDIGVEIEFNASEYYDSAALSAALWDKGYSTTPQQQEKATNPEVYQFGPRSWRFETDPSVDGGEIISPRTEHAQIRLLTEQIDDINQLILRHGGTTQKTVRTSGLHVHVDVSMLTEVTHWQALFSFYHHFENALILLAADERYETHRPFAFLARLPQAPLLSEADVTSRHIIRHYANRNALLNTFQVSKPGKGHVEFKLWDSTLDTRQTMRQVLISQSIVGFASVPGALDILATSGVGIEDMLSLLKEHGGLSDSQMR